MNFLFSLTPCILLMFSIHLPHCHYMPFPYAAVAVQYCATYGHHTFTLCFPACCHDYTSRLPSIYIQFVMYLFPS